MCRAKRKIKKPPGQQVAHPQNYKTIGLFSRKKRGKSGNCGGKR
jgi:hypothetical protein